MLCFFFFNDTATTEIYTLSYTTLFRSRKPDDVDAVVLLARRGAPVRRHDRHAELRSEEHTSELQSQSNLVCRLLLEKKKKPKATHYSSHLDVARSSQEAFQHLAS